MNLEVYSIPGKVFLLGEYAVLVGLPAWLMATGPRFRLKVDRTVKSASFPFSPHSPAGRLFAEASRRAPACANYYWEWHDPYENAGGFGASSAQYALVYRALAEVAGWTVSQKHAMELYYSLHQDQALPPSGADVATQWEGGVVRFDKATGAQQFPFNLDHRQMLLFSATGIAGRKIKTHEHLAHIGPNFFQQYKNILQALEKILTRFEDPAQRTMGKFAEALDAYAGVIAEAGLESAEAGQDRIALRAQPGVLAVKGVGAGLSDGLWVILDSPENTLQREHIIRLAESRELKTLPFAMEKLGISG